jgi:hypothetical protein
MYDRRFVIMIRITFNNLLTFPARFTIFHNDLSKPKKPNKIIGRLLLWL